MCCQHRTINIIIHDGMVDFCRTINRKTMLIDFLVIPFGAAVCINFNRDWKEETNMGEVR